VPDHVVARSIAQARSDGYSRDLGSSEPSSAEKCPSDTARLYRDGSVTPYRVWQGTQNSESLTFSGLSGEAQMTTKKVVGWLVVIFVVFFIVTQPSQAANIAHDLWNGIINIFHGIGDFISSL
jgi:hypothetical protein